MLLGVNSLNYFSLSTILILMKDLFNVVKFNKLARNTFDLSHDLKLSFRMGELVPTCVMDVLPGDKFTIRPTNMLRFAPLVSPVMHRVRVKTNYFFIPTRLVWDDFEDWITGNTDVQAPFILPNEVAEGSIADYMGVPTGEYEENVKVSPIPFAAYAMVWDEYYRDQNLQTEVFEGLIPGNNSVNYNSYLTARPYKRAWQHDYLTSCLPSPQAGDAVTLPLTSQDNVLVQYDDTNTLPGLLVDVPSGTPAGPGDVTSSLTGQMGVGGDSASYDPDGSLYVDVQSDAVDINTLRRAFRLQEFLERTIRGGQRYFEQIRSHFNSPSPDARLQRPEYIGGSTQNMVISEVLSTAQSNNDGATAEVAVGTMAGHGISVGGGDSFTFTAPEHGYIIGIISVIPDTAYQDGLHRHFSRHDRFDYAWPSFANIGEQAVLLKEVKARVEAGTDPEAVFGYQSRYAEYKYMNSRVAGEMRSSLAFWHLGRIFSGVTNPALNAEFIRCNPDPRIFAVTSDEADHIYAHVMNSIRATRMLPRYGIPTI